jgi:hypothetical protein
VIEIAESGVDTLAEYASISAAYRVMEIVDLDTSATDSNELAYAKTSVRAPYTKDYDALPGNHSLDGRRGSMSRIGDFSLRALGCVESGEPSWPAAPASGQRSSRRPKRGHETTAGDPSSPRRRIRMCPACRFYPRAGYSLHDIRRGAYTELPDEVQLIWIKDL